MKNAAARLAQHLRSLSRSETVALSDEAGVARGLGFRARNGRRVSATAYLLLCLAVGAEPSMGSPVAKAPRNGSSIAWPTFGSALFLTRRLRRLDLRSAAGCVGVSVATLSRAEHGRPVAVESYLKIAKFIGLPPAAFLCFTETATVTRCKSTDLEARGRREQPQPRAALR